MAVHSGFFNSSNSDRKYNAEHFSRFFDGLICDGVYVNYPEKDDNGNYTDATARGFYVSPGSGIAVNVARGRCFFDGYWMYTDAVTVINLSSLVPSNSLSKKLVAIFIDVDTSLEGRELKFVAVAGNEVANDDQHTADPPTPANTQSHKQYPIALIAMNGNVPAINAANIYRFDTLYGDTDYRKAYFANTASVEALLEYSSRTKAEIDQRISKIEAPTFTEASTLANINSGENINTLWGKIKKAFTDLIFNPGSGNAKKAWIVGSDGKGSFKAIKDTFDSDALFSRSTPGIVPTAPSGSGTDKFLREDGSWSAPVGTNTNAQTVGNVEIAYNNGYPSYKYNGAWRRFKDPTGTASAGDVLSGKTFANADSDTLVTGTMTNRGAVSQSLNCGGSYTIPSGYHNGSGKVTANSLASQTSANATAGQILKDKTAWVNGSKITGTMTNQGGQTTRQSTSTNGTNAYSRIPQGAYLTNAGGQNYPEIVTPLSDFGNAAASQVLSGKTFTSTAGLKVNGTMASKASYTAAVSVGTSYEQLYVRIPQGAYLTNSSMGNPEITVPYSSLEQSSTHILSIPANSRDGFIRIYLNFITYIQITGRSNIGLIECAVYDQAGNVLRGWTTIATSTPYNLNFPDNALYVDIHFTSSNTSIAADLYYVEKIVPCPYHPH